MRYNAYRQRHDAFTTRTYHGRHAATVIALARPRSSRSRNSRLYRYPRNAVARYFQQCGSQRFGDPALHLQQTAGFSPATHGTDQIAAFQLLLNFRGEFSRRRLPSSSAFGSSISEWSASWCVRCCARRRRSRFSTNNSSARPAHPHDRYDRYGERRTRSPSGYIVSSPPKRYVQRPDHAPQHGGDQMSRRPPFRRSSSPRSARSYRHSTRRCCSCY